MQVIKLISYILVSVVIVLFALFFLRAPSNDRVWNKDQQLLSYADIKDDTVEVYNIRNIDYSSTTDYKVSYYNSTYNLSDISSMYFVLEPFKNEWDGAAHTFLSFGFEDGRYLAVSVEIRKEAGESFSAIKGLFRNYELMYVFADERDVIMLRSNFRGDDVYVYPVNTTKEKMKMLFLDIANRANKLRDKPEFYNTLTSTCTTNIVDHINRISPSRVPFSLKILAPGFSDELAYNLGLINTTLTLEEARNFYKINERALKFADDPDFSDKIRMPLKQ